MSTILHSNAKYLILKETEMLCAIETLMNIEGYRNDFLITRYDGSLT